MNKERGVIGQRAFLIRKAFLFFLAIDEKKSLQIAEMYNHFFIKGLKNVF
jgi:hypothetical protein